VTKDQEVRFLRQVAAIVAKDLAAEMHTREIVSAMLSFAVVALVVFSFTLDLRKTMARDAAPGVLWATVAFAGTLGLSRSLAREQQTGCIDGLLLASTDRSAIFFGKALGNLVLVAIVESILLLLFSLLFDVPLLRLEVALVAILGTVGYTAAGTLLATMAVNTRAREVMLPILLLPLATPALIAAAQATGGLVSGATLAEMGGWIRLLVAYDLIIVAVSILTFGHLVEE
jgi:heme exporter protein B